MDAGNSLQSITVTSLETAGALRLSGVDVVLNQVISAADITGGLLTFTPAANANGAGYASFGFKVSDGTALSASAYTMTVNVTALNDAPTASNRTVSTAEDAAKVLSVADFGFVDVDAGNSLQSITVTSLETAGALRLSGVDVVLNQVISAADITGGLLTFTPAANANGVGYASFGFKVSDGAARSASAYTMTFNVLPIRDDLSITGTLAGDVLFGDQIDAGSFDILYGLAGDDSLSGLAGNDTLVGGAGLDTLDGGAGRDTVLYTDTVMAVQVTLNGANDVILRFGDLSEDVLRSVEDVVGGTVGDTLTGDALANQLSGGGGNDTLSGMGGNDALSGGPGSDILKGGLGTDTLDGGLGRDAASYADKALGIELSLNGTADSIVLVGGVVEDSLRGIENVLGGLAADRLKGDGLANQLSGNGGNDTLVGMGGDDTLIGAAANDVLAGGEGADRLFGGPGADRFVFDIAPSISSMDVIMDFSPGTDKLVLDDDIFSALGVTGTPEGVGLANALVLQIGPDADDAADRLIYDSATGALYYDSDGSGGESRVQIALLGTAKALQISDFLIVD